MANDTCINGLQKSLKWCEGTPVLPGVRRRMFYLSKSAIAAWPTLPKDEQGRPTSAEYQGDFTLVADVKWKYIDVLPSKSQLVSEAQGEMPSQTQLNTLTAVHPGVGVDATAAAAYLNNSDNVFLVPDAMGKYRVVGCEMWESTTTVAQDLGQGPTGTASTTITCKASDVVPAPFYSGKIETEDGDIMGDGSPADDDGV